MTKLEELHAAGQSVWLDFISRGMLEAGELDDLVERGLRGLTSNPSIFQKAIGQSDDYDDDLASLLNDAPADDINGIYERLVIGDIQAAADALRSVYDSSNGTDGFVSLEVSPLLASDTQATIDEARKLWKLVDRPNLMIKVPATPEGIPAIESLIADGINVNVTLMFSMDHYEAVATAYLRGISQTADPSKVASVASFFVSRVDGKVDAALESVGTDEALELRGKIAVDNSKAVYKRYQELFEGEAFADLANRGARPQRVLWASTSTKNPDYSDVLYVDELVGPNTVNTLPPATLEAFEDHGTVDASAITNDLDASLSRLERLGAVGVDLDAITDELQTEGVESFSQAFEDLMSTLENKVEKLSSE